MVKVGWYVFTFFISLTLVFFQGVKDRELEWDDSTLSF